MIDYSQEPSDKETVELFRYSGNSTAQESSKTIDRATKLNLHPDEYDSMKESLDPEMDIQERVPATVSEPTKNYMKKSSKHSESVKDEVGVLDTLSRQASYIWYNLTEKQNIEQEIQRLNNKDRTSENGLTEEEYQNLDGLYDIQEEEISQFQLEGSEQIPGQVAGVVNDMFQAITDNKLLIAGSTAAGVAVGTLTPFGPVGSTAGAIAGGAAGATLALTKDAFYRTTEMTYGELRRMKTPDGSNLNLDRNSRENISLAVGAASAVAEAASGGVLTFGLGRIASRSASSSLLRRVVTNPKMLKQFQVLGEAVKSSLASGTEEVAAEIVSIMGENYALTKADGAEGNILEAAEMTASQIWNDKETQERLKMTGTVGAVAGGGTTVVGGQVILQGKRVKDRLGKARQTIETQNDILNTAATANQTQLKQLSPEQMAEYRREIFSNSKGTFSFNEDDVKAIAESNPEMASKIRSKDITNSSTESTGSGVILNPHDFLELVEEAPTISEYVRMNPEAPNPLESKQVLQRFDELQQQRNEILSSLGVDQELSPEQIKTLEELDAKVEEEFENDGMVNYVEEFTIPEIAREIMPEKQLNSYLDAQRKTREKVASRIWEKFDEEQQRIENRVVRYNERIEQQRLEKEYKTELDLVAKFRGDSKIKIEGHSRKGYSSLAIDPDTLPVDLREAYLEDTKLKNNKAFVKGGITLEESAALAGYESGEQMLKTLANAPTKQEIVEMRRERVKKIRKQVKEVRGKSYIERLDATFDDVAKLHKQEMEIMKSDQWTQTKSGFRRVTLPVPKVEDINYQAKGIISRTKIEALSPKQFNQAEIKQQRNYTSHILNNEVDQAFRAKEKALLNSELSRESLRAKKKIDQAKSLVKRIQSDRVQKSLKASGLDKEVNSILNVFNLNTKDNKLASKQEGYLEYIRKKEAEGETVIVPEALADVRTRGSDLTVEQYLKLTDRLRTLEHQSKLKNKLIKLKAKREEMGKLATIEAVVMEAKEDLESHPLYKESRSEEIRNANSKGLDQKFKEWQGYGSSVITNLKNIATQLDRENLGGQHYNTIAQPLVDAETFKRDLNSQTANKIKEIAKQYGDEDFKNAFVETTYIPEFEGFKDLGGGNMVKADLWRLFSYLGDPNGRERISNFKHHETGASISFEQMRGILEKHLDHKDARLAQNMTNIFKSFEEDAKQLHLRTTGIEPDMVKGVPIEFKGRVYEGGYVPLDYINTSTDEKISRFLDVMGNKETSMFGGKGEESRLYSALRSAEKTEQGRLMDRSNSSRPLDTDFRGFLNAYEEHIHDISYREVGMDSLNLLRNPVYEKAIKGVVGAEKYDNIVSSIIETVGKTNNDDILSPFSSEHKKMNKIYRWLEQNFNIAQLGFNYKSVLMQPLSLGTAKLRMGKTGGRYISKSFGKMIANLDDFQSYWDQAVEVLPDLARNKDGVDDTLVPSTFDFIPPEGRRTLPKKLDAVKRGRDNFKEWSMLGLQKFDIYIKAGVALGAYNQFMDGNAKNFSSERLAKMTFDERHAAAKKYVKQVADLSLTTSATIDKSTIEKLSMMRIFTRFYTDVRSQLNTGLSQTRKIRIGLKEGNYGDVAYDASALMLVYGLNRAYTDTLYGEDNPITDITKVDDMTSLGNYVSDTAAYFTTSVPSTLVGSTPVARDIQFAYNGWGYKKRAQTWLGRVMSDTAMTITGIADLLEGNGMDEQQRKAAYFTASYLGGSFPVNGPLKIYDMLEEAHLIGSPTDFMKREIQRMNEGIESYIEKNKDNPEAQPVIEGLKEVQKNYVPAEEKSGSNLIPEGTVDALKFNSWDSYDKETGGAGVFGFTEERWDEIAETAPELELSEEGRVSQDISQQERAMQWELEQNAKSLESLQLDVTLENLYGAHRFGVDDYVMVLVSSNDEKIEDIVSNPDLFKGFQTVKQVKDFVAKKLK